MPVLGAEPLGLQLHVLDQQRAIDAFGKTGKVLDQSGERQLAARLMTAHNEGLQVRASRVDGGRVSGAAGADDHNVSHERTRQGRTKFHASMGLLQPPVIGAAFTRLALGAAGFLAGTLAAGVAVTEGSIRIGRSRRIAPDEHLAESTAAECACGLGTGRDRGCRWHSASRVAVHAARSSVAGGAGAARTRQQPARHSFDRGDAAAQWVSRADPR